MDLLRLVYVLVLIPKARILVEAQNGTTFNFPTFTSTNENDLLFSGDASVTFTEDLIWLNELGMACGSFLYAEPIQMRGSNSSAMASFSTSFTFSILGTNSAGFAFAFLPQNHTTGVGGGQLCLLSEQESGDTGSQFFAVEFDTWKNPEYNDPSNNHVGVNINSMNSTESYNLCGAGTDNCSYLVSDYASIFDPGNNFTSWIDFDSVTQSLAVFLTNGSTMRGAKKPASAIIQVSVNLSDVMNENMFVGFTGSVVDNKEVKKIKSWSFNTSFNHTQASPTSGPSNNAPAPSLSPGNIAPAPSTGGRGTNGSKAKLAGGIIFVGVAGLLATVIIYKIYKVFWRPLRFFLSHAGGKKQEHKNFADSLYRKMTKSWMLKPFIKVFMDRECLDKGRPFSVQLMQELKKTEVGIVVVTAEFFTRKWPMTELVSLVNSQEDNPAVRILPLFYRMTVAEVRAHLSTGKWDQAWTQMSSEVNHPVPLEDCREAVKRLCIMNGIEYNSNNWGHDREYIDLILMEVGKIVREEILKKLKKLK